MASRDFDRLERKLVAARRIRENFIRDATGNAFLGVLGDNTRIDTGDLFFSLGDDGQGRFGWGHRSPQLLGKLGVLPGQVRNTWNKEDFERSLRQANRAMLDAAADASRYEINRTMRPLTEF